MERLTELVGIRAELTMKMYNADPTVTMTECYAIIRHAEASLNLAFVGHSVPGLSQELIAIRDRFGILACAAVQELAVMSAEGVWGDTAQDTIRSDSVAGATRSQPQRLCSGGH